MEKGGSLSDIFEELYGSDFNESSPIDYCCDTGDVCNLEEGVEFGATFIPVLYSVAFVVGVLGNGVLLGVLARSRNNWSVTDTFILHLTLADVLLLVTLPFWAAQAAQDHGWSFGTPLCKITGAVFMVRGVGQERCTKILQKGHNNKYMVVAFFNIFFLILWLIHSTFRLTSTVESSSWLASVWTATCRSSMLLRCTPAGSPGPFMSAAQLCGFSPCSSPSLT